MMGLRKERKKRKEKKITVVLNITQTTDAIKEKYYCSINVRLKFGFIIYEKKNIYQKNLTKQIT